MKKILTLSIFSLILSFNSVWAQCPNVNLPVIGDTICIGTFAEVTILNSEIGVTYSAFEGGMSISNLIIGTGGNIIINITGLQPGIHMISIAATTPGCGTVNLINLAQIIVNAIPVANLLITAKSPICYGQSSIVKIHNSISGAKYNLSLNGISYSSYLGSGGDLEIDVPSTLLLPGVNKVNINSVFSGCNVVILQQTVDIIANVSPQFMFQASGSTVTNAKDSAFVVISFPPAGTILLIRQTNKLETLISQSSVNSTIYKFHVDKDISDDFIVEVSATTIGCEMKTYSDTALIKVQRILTTLPIDKPIFDFNLYPNPYTSFLTVENVSNFHRILIVNTLGTKVYDASFELTNNKIINANIPKGIYTLQIEGLNYKMHRKLIKE